MKIVPWPADKHLIGWFLSGNEGDVHCFAIYPHSGVHLDWSHFVMLYDESLTVILRPYQ